MAIRGVLLLKINILVVHDATVTDYSLKPQNKTNFLELNIKEGLIPSLIQNRFTEC